MTPKFVIIEDSMEDYQTVRKVLSEYDVQVFPANTDQWKVFSELLTRYANLHREDELKKIKSILIEEKPDYVFIDIGLNFDRSDDHTGLELKKIIDEKYPLAKQFIISMYRIEDFTEMDLKYDAWIYKKRTASIPGQIKPLMYKFQIPRFSDKTPDSHPEYFEEPKILQKWKDIGKYKVSPWPAFIIPNVITYAFYLVLLALFLAGAYLIGQKIIAVIYGKVDIIKVAEFVFIAFLPFLIAAGFFIFYKRSLNSYFLKEINDPRKEDFEAAGKLMSLTKKLFISSLISYLFIRMVELLFMDETHHNGTSEVTFDDYYRVNPYDQIYFLGGLLVMLITYFIFIERGHNNKNDKH